jgi:hypothetical protein
MRQPAPTSQVTGVMYYRPARRRRKPRRAWPFGLTALLLMALVGTAAVSVNAFGVGERFENLVARVDLFLNPPPDRPTRATVIVTPRPVAANNPAPASQPPKAGTGATKSPKPTPTPKPVRKPVDFRLPVNPQKVFAHQLTKDWCAVAGTQIVLAMLGKADTSDAFQRKLAGRIDEWESWRDSHNGNWGPAAIAEALAAYGAPEYEIHAYESRQDALRGSAVALKETGKPVVIIAWRGAHTWIMSGYRADADPTVFDDANITGTYVLDPWYPWVSSIWGPSDPPGTFQDASEMRRNFLAWERPEGRYPDRDGKFLVLVPSR